MTRPLATASEIQARLGVSRSTLSRWIASRGLPCYRIGGTLRFDPEAVEAWLEARSQAEPVPRVRRTQVVATTTSKDTVILWGRSRFRPDS